MIPKRVFWLAVGYTAGLGTSYWAARKVRATMDRFTPDSVVGRVTDSVDGLRAQVGDAVRDGRKAMQAREAELWARTGLNAGGGQPVGR